MAALMFRTSMRFPLLSLFKRSENSTAAKRERQSERERMLTEGLRTLSKLAMELADRLEKQRLAREGYEPQDQYLKRTDTQR
jgi:hypothetical protein